MGGGNMPPPLEKNPVGPKNLFLHKMQEQPLIDVLKVKMALLTRFLVFGDHFRATENRRINSKFSITFQNG